MSFRGKKNYYHHDDRGGSGSYTGRHVSFKSNRNNRQRLQDQILRKYFDDGDVEMAPKGNQSRGLKFRYNPMSGRRSDFSAQNTGNKPKRPMFPGSPSSWYKVVLSHGKKYSRQELIAAVQSAIQPVSFVPVNVKVEGDDLTFFVDNEDTAKAIYGSNFKIQMGDGWKIQMKVRPNMPFVEVNDSLKEKIKLVMSSKYNAVEQKLDLSKFHINEEFLNNDLFVPLNRQNMLLAVFQIIADSVPNLLSLDLSDNKIFSTEHFSMLKRHAPDLKSLNLSKNKIRNLSTLTCLQGMRLEVLILDENPLCDEFHDQIIYVREVRKIFKSLRLLDGVDLPPPVDFDIEEVQTKLPKSHDSFLCNAEGQTFTRQFLEQYFGMYDNQNGRDALAEAYAENSQFSMVAYSSNSGVNLSKYITESRNFKKVNNFERRSRLLHYGKSEIVRFLNTLPRTQHDLPSFTVDLLVFTPELISLCVCGIFRESEMVVENKAPFIKSFSRTFVLIPVGPGFNIINDMLSITNASSTQIAKAFQTVTSPPSTSSVPTSPQAPVDVAAQEELNRKREMVTTLGVQTGMNLMWAEKCLVETNWDFNNALYAFTEFNKVGKIPAEAFNK